MNNRKASFVPVGIFFEGVTKEQQIDLEGPLLRELDRVLGNTQWRYTDWSHGYFGMDIYFYLPGEEDLGFADRVVTRAMYAWSTILSGFLAHPNAQLVSWPDEDAVRAHIEDQDNIIPNPTITWVD